MNIIIIFLVVAAIAIFVGPMLRNAIGEKGVDSRRDSIYKKREKVMNPSEQAFFLELHKQIPTFYYIFPKMRIADILEIKNGKGYYHMRNEILPKHIDFLICDMYFKPIIAIEVNGGYHNNPAQQEKDLEKKRAIESTGLLFETVNVGTDFSQNINLIKSKLR